MNVLIIQENGRHDKNRHFRECFSLQRSFESIGVSAQVWGLNHENPVPFELVESWCDVIFVFENYPSKWLPIDSIKKSNKLKIFWSIDSHCNLNVHKKMTQDMDIDILLSSTERYINEYVDISKKQYWLPNAYPHDLIYPKNTKKIYDVGFCGNVNNRREYLEFLNSQSNITSKIDVFVIGDDMVNAINSYKVHFNRNISDDINYRTFETTGTKTVLLTNYTPNLEKLFDIGTEILVYDDKFDLLEKISYIRDNPSKMKEIAEAGYARSLNNHTYNHRAKQIIDIINEYK